MLKSWCRIFRGSHLIGGNISTYHNRKMDFELMQPFVAITTTKQFGLQSQGSSYKWPNGSLSNLLICCNFKLLK